MATRAMSTRKSRGNTDWRAAFRRSMRRAAQMTGAVVLFGAMIFLALSLASYTQTDPSGSTAASGNDIRNWMGASGAWVSDKVLGTFGLTSVLLLPLLYITARGLWREIEHEGEDEGTRWWLPLGMLVLAMTLISTVLALAFDGPGGTLPAQAGGISGLLKRLKDRFQFIRTNTDARVAHLKAQPHHL